jgi:hypothetical protein
MPRALAVVEVNLLFGVAGLQWLGTNRATSAGTTVDALGRWPPTAELAKLVGALDVASDEDQRERCFGRTVTAVHDIVYSVV